MEIAIVLALGLGQSAVYAIVQLAYRLTDEVPLAEQVAKLNPSRSDRIFDLIYQVLAIGFSLVPVVLVCFLLWQSRRPHLARLGLDGTGVAKDAGRGVLLVLAIGIPGLGLYLAGRALGLTVAIDPAGIDAYWWTVPVLLLAAARHRCRRSSSCSDTSSRGSGSSAGARGRSSSPRRSCGPATTSTRGIRRSSATSRWACSSDGCISGRAG